MPWKAVKSGQEYILRREHRAGIFGKREEVLRLQIDTSRTGKPVEILCYADERLAFYCLVGRVELSVFVCRLASYIEGATPSKKFAPSIFWQPMLVALSQVLAEDYDLELAKLEAERDVTRSELSIARESEKLVSQIKKLVAGHEAPTTIVSPTNEETLTNLLGHPNPEVHEMVAWLYDAEHIKTFYVKEVRGHFKCTLLFTDDRVFTISSPTLREMYTNAVVVGQNAY